MASPKGREVKRTALKRKTPLKAHKGLNKVSDKQKVINKLWGEITDEVAEERGFICQWCGKPGQRTDPTTFDYLNGHHKIPRRYGIHTKKNCYIVHQVICHPMADRFVKEYPNGK